jgi:hypothetical protein
VTARLATRRFLLTDIGKIPFLQSYPKTVKPCRATSHHALQGVMANAPPRFEGMLAQGRLCRRRISSTSRDPE